jgi:hypothetical protein
MKKPSNFDTSKCWSAWQPLRSVDTSHEFCVVRHKIWSHDTNGKGSILVVQHKTGDTTQKFVFLANTPLDLWTLLAPRFPFHKCFWWPSCNNTIWPICTNRGFCVAPCHVTKHRRIYENILYEVVYWLENSILQYTTILSLSYETMRIFSYFFVYFYEDFPRNLTKIYLIWHFLPHFFRIFLYFFIFFRIFSYIFVYLRWF